MDSNWTNFIIFCIVSVHIRCIVGSIYVHRGIAHSMFTFSAPIHHFCRFILWINNSIWPTWVEHYIVMHRKHHKYTDLPDDPHSPNQLHFYQIFDYKHNEPGRPYYISPDDFKMFAPSITTSNDWMQQNVYNRYQNYGIIFQYILVLILFDPLIFIVSLPVLYFLATDFFVFAGNWLPHKIGYKPVTTKRKIDNSRNILPIAIFFAGEELHANHHDNPSLVNFGRKWFEFDLGYWYARVFIFVGLMQIAKKQTKEII